MASQQKKGSVRYVLKIPGITNFGDFEFNASGVVQAFLDEDGS
jgi:hypothetical protein